MRECDMKSAKGFTLMELLVVLLIIGILSTVALRTIDATRDQSLFDQTSKEMGQLIQSITGNPDLTYDGRRIDFGYYGDMGRLPEQLKDLVQNPGDTNWHGPYVRRTFGGDTAGYLYDAWGHLYSWDAPSGMLRSLGNGKYPLTMKVADSLTQLYNSTISGTVTDADNNPPGKKSGNILLVLYVSSRPFPRYKNPDGGGYYSFSLAAGDTIPIGTHRLVAKMSGGDSISRWLSVSPRSRSVVDFRFGKAFRNKLVMIGPAKMDISDTAGFTMTLANAGTTDDTVSSVTILDCPVPDTAYWLRTITINGAFAPSYPCSTGQRGYHKGDVIPLNTQVIFPPEMGQPIVIGLQNFWADSTGSTTKQSLVGSTFRLRFDDGSEIVARPQLW
jgi:prepilin-type N-terminal cleavage/methylation domain-containing protein